MAENKKSFLLYADYIDTIEGLTDEEAGRLMKHLFRYVNDKNPESNDRIVQVAFDPIKRQLKRDLKKYEEVKETKSVSGVVGNLKRWHPDLYAQYKSQKLTIDEAMRIAENRKKSQTDDVQSHPIAKIAVNDTDNVNDTVINKDKVYEYLRGAAPIGTPKAELDAEVVKLMNYYAGKKIGNLKIVCNKWMMNFAAGETMPAAPQEKRMVI